jgi:hypothetical protein
MAQEMSKTIEIQLQALDGRNGKPLQNQRLLVFTGSSVNDLKSHATHLSLTTDKEGLGTLTINGETRWIQVWTDGRILCQADPNQGTFSVATILSEGLVAPNNCSSLVRDPTPGHIIVFARPAHFLEKMKR